MSTISQQAVDHVFLILGVVVLAQFQREQHVLGDGQRVEQRARLEHHRDLLADAAQFGLGEIGDVLVGDDDAALSGLRKPMMWDRVTDLPTPLRPMIATVSPGST